MIHVFIIILYTFIYIILATDYIQIGHCNISVQIFILISVTCIYACVSVFTYYCVCTLKYYYVSGEESLHVSLTDIGTGHQIHKLTYCTSINLHVAPGRHLHERTYVCTHNA